MDVIKAIMQDRRYWAHTCDGKEPELLYEHSQLCQEYYNEYCQKKGVEGVVKKAIAACGCGMEDVEKVYQLFIDAIYQHDVGKINPTYQKNVLKNMQFSAGDQSSKHGLLSAYIYMNEHLGKMDPNEQKKLSYFLFAFSYSIARHHGYLKNMEEFHEVLPLCHERKGCYDKRLNLEKNSIFTSAKGYNRLKRVVDGEVAFYILNKLLFSLITACDYCATSEYMSGKKTVINVIGESGYLEQRYRNGDLYKKIEEWKTTPAMFQGSINELRCQMFLESEERLRKETNAGLYYLEAPTGSGKTNMSINLFLRLLEQDKKLNNVFYIFPFNTLVEQTAEELEKYFIYGEEMTVVNSLAPIYVSGSTIQKGKRFPQKMKEECDYQNAVINKMFNNYPVVVTSHVNFFNALFGTGREQCFPLTKLCNSVVIIDEIQSYNNKIWRQIILFLLTYADILQMKVIIMSATLPKLDWLLGEHKHRVVDLIADPQRYYRNPLFKNRVELDFSLLKQGKVDLGQLYEAVKVHKGKKILVEFISKASAREFYNLLCQDDELYCIEITGDDNIRARKKMIREIKSRDAIVVVATQVIEAGVDIDMDVGFKDISLPDAEEQFLGRINRSCLKKGCKAYFFIYDDARKVYGEDERLQYPITESNIASLLQEKNFKEIYELVLHDIKKRTEGKTAQHIGYTYKNCLELMYQDVEKQMQLIPTTYQMFLAYTIQDGDELLEGKRVWEVYKEICRNQNMEYGEKRVELSRLAEDMACFTYTIYCFGNHEMACDEEFGGYYYIENGECFIENGKFDRKAFSNRTKGLFL